MYNRAYYVKRSLEIQKGIPKEVPLGSYVFQNISREIQIYLGKEE